MDVAGGSHDSTDKACISMPSEPAGFGYITWNITDLIIRMVEDESQTVINLMMITPEGGATYSASMKDAEDATAENHPLFGLEYTPTILKYLNVVFFEGINEVLLNGSSVANNSVTAYNVSELANITSSGLFNFYEVQEWGNHTHTNPFFLSMVTNYTLYVIPVPSSVSGTVGNNNYMIMGVFAIGIMGTAFFVLVKKKR